MPRKWARRLLRAIAKAHTESMVQPYEDVKELVETIISDSWSFPALRP